MNVMRDERRRWHGRAGHAHLELPLATTPRHDVAWRKQHIGRGARRLGDARAQASDRLLQLAAAGDMVRMDVGVEGEGGRAAQLAHVRQVALDVLRGMWGIS